MKTTFEFDALNRQRRIVDGAQLTNPESLAKYGHSLPSAAMDYDAVGNVVTITTNASPASAEKSIVTQFTYDQLQNKLGVIVGANDPANQKYELFMHDTVGNLILSWDAQNAFKLFDYDGLNRRTVEILASGEDEEVRTTVTYDAFEGITSRESGLNKVTFEVDRLGRTRKENDNAKHWLEYKYDPAGNQTEVIDVVYPSYWDAKHKEIIPSSSPRNVSIKTWYDSLNRVYATTDPAGKSDAIFHDALGRVTSVYARGYGVVGTVWERQDFEYDALDRKVREKWFDDQQGESKLVKTLGYTSRGQE